MGYLLGHEDGIAIDVCRPPAARRLVDYGLAGAAQVLHKAGERRPDGGVHVDVVAIGDVLLVHQVGQHAPASVTHANEYERRGKTEGREKERDKNALASENVEVAAFELATVLIHELAGILGEHGHLAKMTLGLAMTLVAVLVATLLFANLTIPTQLSAGAMKTEMESRNFNTRTF